MTDAVAHLCPRCARPYLLKDPFVYLQQWNALERIVARALYRFYGCCTACTRKFLANEFREDNEISLLRTHDTAAGVLFSTRAISPLVSPPFKPENPTT